MNDEEGDYIPPEEPESEPEPVQEYDDSVSESDLREGAADGSSSDSEEEQPRRSTRDRRAPLKLTFDEIGGVPSFRR